MCRIMERDSRGRSARWCRPRKAGTPRYPTPPQYKNRPAKTPVASLFKTRIEENTGTFRRSSRPGYTSDIRPPRSPNRTHPQFCQTTELPHSLSPPLIGQRLNPLSLELNVNLVAEPSSLHNSSHALVPFGPEERCTNGLQSIPVNEATQEESVSLRLSELLNIQCLPFRLLQHKNSQAVIRGSPMGPWGEPRDRDSSGCRIPILLVLFRYLHKRYRRLCG